MHLRDHTQFRCHRCTMLTLELEDSHQEAMCLCTECIEELRDGGSAKPPMMQDSRPGKWTDETAAGTTGRRSQS